MSAALIPVIIALVLLIVLGIAIARVTRSSRIREAALGADLAYVARWTSAWRWAGLAVALAAALAALVLDHNGSHGSGRIAMAAPAITGCILLAATIIGEVSARPPRTSIRVAGLTTRSLHSLLPRRRTILVGCGAVLLVLTLTLTTITASPDDQGRAGRSLTRTCIDTLPGAVDAIVTSSHSPWPGRFYSLPMAGAILLTLALAAIGALAIRDRANPDPAHAEADLGLRRQAMQRVVSAVGATVFGTLGPTLIVMSTATSNNRCINGGKAFTGVLVLSGLVAILLAVVLLANLLLPARGSTAPDAGRTQRYAETGR